MAILADTNILLSTQNPSHLHYRSTSAVLHALRLRNETLCVTPQNLIEFWAVATRPAEANGLGMEVDEAAKELTTLRRFFRLLLTTPDIIVLDPAALVTS